MKTPQYEQRNEDPMAMIWILIAVNVIMFLLPQDFSERFILSGDFIKDHAWYQLITAGFMHGGFGHLFFNMWGLYIFGTLVTPHIGNKRFLLLYFLGVLTGNLLFAAFNRGQSLLGASGAVCAVMAAAAVLEPNRQFVIIFFPFFPLKTSTLVVAYTVIEVITQLTGSSGGVATIAHLGGFLAGYVYLKILYGNQLPWDPLRRKKKSASSFRGPADWTARDYRESAPPPPSGGNTDNTPVTTKELDYLLDKISRQGINSLSEHELMRLRLARKQMRGE